MQVGDGGLALLLAKGSGNHQKKALALKHLSWQGCQFGTKACPCLRQSSGTAARSPHMPTDPGSRGKMGLRNPPARHLGGEAAGSPKSQDPQRHASPPPPPLLTLPSPLPVPGNGRNGEHSLPTLLLPLHGRHHGTGTPLAAPQPPQQRRPADAHGCWWGCRCLPLSG